MQDIVNDERIETRHAPRDVAGDTHPAAEQDLFNSEGEDRGAAMGAVMLTGAAICVAGVAVAALMLRG